MRRRRPLRRTRRRTALRLRLHLAHLNHSAGVITPLAAHPYFIVIEQAWRDEGTSSHYLPPAEWADLDHELSEALIGAFDELDEPVHRGRSWTTDAPFRETPSAIASATAAGVHAVEMEAASLYAYAFAARAPVDIAAWPDFEDYDRS